MANDKKIERINQIIADYAKILEQIPKLYEFNRNLALRIHFMLFYPPQKDDDEDIFSGFPRIEDYDPQLKKEKMTKEVEKTVQRRRKLSAKDMVEMYILHVDKHLSFRNIAEQFKVNESMVRKGFLKVKKIVETFK
jgi:hypothetical protein